MEAIDRFVQVVLVKELQKPTKFIVQVWDGEEWSTIREILTTVSNPEQHRWARITAERARITAENVVLKIQNMALHFAISEISTEILGVSATRCNKCGRNGSEKVVGELCGASGFCMGIFTAC